MRGEVPHKCKKGLCIWCSIRKKKGVASSHDAIYYNTRNVGANYASGHNTLSAALDVTQFN